MSMKNSEPTLEEIEDYDGKESSQKRKTIWIVILSGLAIAIIYGVFNANYNVSNNEETPTTGIIKY